MGDGIIDIPLGTELHDTHDFTSLGDHIRLNWTGCPIISGEVL